MAKTVRQKKPGTCAGYSLVELSVALAILIVGTMGVIQMYSYGIGKIRTLNENTLAETLVQNETECLRAASFRDLTNAETAPFRSQALDQTDLHDAKGNVAIRDFPGAEGKLKEITVTLRWTTENARVAERSSVTLIADKETP